MILALVYLTRQVVLYLFVLLMPLLIVFWVPGVGPFSLASQFMKRLAGFYVPFLFMTVPVALLLRVGQLLGSSATLSMDGVGQWLLAILTPLVAVISPFVLFWQAGALFFMADSAARHTSRDHGKARIAKARTAGATTQTGTQNFSRGLQGKPAVRPDGQVVLGSGNSRAHAVGTRLNATATSLQSRISTKTTHSENVQQTTETRTSDSRNNQFETLRDRGTSSESGPRHDERTDSTDGPSSADPDDDRPRYIN
ncbi:hypothetical protein ACFQL1_06685 [Halomicroarcula sp. GCM10025709]|uniref:hypothetical protein n=1 Tax=Halomicroarcula sp. GCM10025709 TaxID=3252669 RepID=UPI0036088319